MHLTLKVRKTLGSFTLDADVAVTGDRIGLFGASGSGKSTLVSILAGLVKPDCGEIIFDDVCLFSSSRKIDCRPERRRIALVFQQHGLFPHLNVKSNLLYGHVRCAPEHRRVDFESLLDVLQIRHLLDRGINNLSGGEKQRVAIGRAVLSNPRLLLMDEPLSALDDSLRFQIIPYLKSVGERFNIPYLFISHSMMEMRLMSEQVLSIAAGQVEGQISTEQLARNVMGHSPVGYINILGLSDMNERDGLCVYSWNGSELLLSLSNRDTRSGLFELSSKDIMLFKKHPEAISARNLLKCTVAGLFETGAKTGVELDTGSGRLISEIVPDAVRELDIESGSVVYAAIKASAFRKLTTTQAGIRS